MEGWTYEFRTIFHVQLFAVTLTTIINVDVPWNTIAFQSFLDINEIFVISMEIFGDAVWPEKYCSNDKNFVIYSKKKAS